MVLTKLEFLHFKATYGPKISTEDTKKVKFKVIKFEGPVAFNRCVIDKIHTQVARIGLHVTAMLT